MILLVAGLAIIVLALIARYDRTMPAWLRGTLMIATIAVLGTGIAIAASFLA